MSVSEVALIIFLFAAAAVFFGFLLPISSVVAGIAALICAIAKLSKN